MDRWSPGGEKRVNHHWEACGKITEFQADVTGLITLLEIFYISLVCVFPGNCAGFNSSYKHNRIWCITLYQSTEWDTGNCLFKIMQFDMKGLFPAKVEILQWGGMMCFVPEVWILHKHRLQFSSQPCEKHPFLIGFGILIKHVCPGRQRQSVWVVTPLWLMSADTWHIHHPLLSPAPQFRVLCRGFLVCAVSNIECLCSFSDELWFWPCWGCIACFGNTCNIPELFVFHPNMLLHSCKLSLVVMQCLARKQRVQMKNSAPVLGKCSETVTESVLLETRQRFPEN